jgi:hypothetical protein
MIGKIPTENEILRERLAWAEGELHRIDLETATMAIAQREKIRVEEEAKAKAAADSAETAALEGHRRNAHFNVGLDRALAGGNDTLSSFLQSSPEEHMARAPDGWPEGHDPSMYRALPANTAPTEPDATVAATALGQALAAKGVTI